MKPGPPPKTASRAGSLPLVGSEVAFDFTNTASGRGHTSHQDHLQSAETVIAWAVHAKVIGAVDAEVLRAAVSSDERLAARMLNEALELRDIIHDIGMEFSSGRRARDQQVDALAKVHADCIARARLTNHGGGFIWTWDARSAPVEVILGPITLSALTLLTRSDLSRIKMCQGEHCGWLFFDVTKNKSRRWCEMEVCGNRAKQKRHQSRQRQD
ncbi:MAG: CGNR zinc finger domain-containing protein [Beijerinckiaceae bacterium]|nr:CGNR zinc finger domain-containing protein [Beijerinckiaceae bacterium]